MNVINSFINNKERSKKAQAQIGKKILDNYSGIDVKHIKKTDLKAISKQELNNNFKEMLKNVHRQNKPKYAISLILHSKLMDFSSRATNSIFDSKTVKIGFMIGILISIAYYLICFYNNYPVSYLLNLLILGTGIVLGKIIKYFN